MADAPPVELVFHGRCPDCGERVVEFPPARPPVGDDFDWMTRDYDSFRLAMLEELFARFPERARWTTADVEVVLVEAFAAVLDQLSDTADRVAAEAYLETARRPESVLRLLRLIGYDALKLARENDQGPFRTERVEGDPRSDEERFLQYWLDNATVMDVARHAGPRAIHTQHRMVSEQDHATRLEQHPLVLRAHAWSEWTGSWNTIRVAIIGWNGRDIDAQVTAKQPGDAADETDGSSYPPDLRREIRQFHRTRELPWPGGDEEDEEEDAYWTENPSIRTVLRPYLDTYRMAGQEVLLESAVPAAITMALSIRIGDRYFRSETRRAIDEVLGPRAGGFFEPGRLQFGEDLYAADIFQAIMALDGVENVCLNRFKRLGSQYANQSTTGVIPFEGLEIAVCDNDPRRPERGYYRLDLHGGRLG